jgi:hypothetical protein
VWVDIAWGQEVSASRNYAGRISEMFLDIEAMSMVPNNNFAVLFVKFH